MGLRIFLSRLPWARCAIDTILYFTVLIPILAILHGWLVPSIRGSFSCNDPSIQFSYTGDTVSTKLLLCATLFLVLVLLLLVEAGNLPRLGWSRATGLAASKAGSIFLRYWVAFTGNILVNLSLKALASTPRPHFIDTCRPDWQRVNCSENGGNVQFDISMCTSEVDERRLHDSMKSFPSGHAQLSCFAAVFVMVYVGRRVSTSHSLLLGPWLQLVSLLLAAFASLSRISDHRHHPVDVLAGATIGVLIGLLAAFSILEISSENKDEEREKKNDDPVCKDVSGSVRREKVKRPSQMRLLSSEFGSVVETEREMREDEPNPTF